MKKILYVASSGGHLQELLRMKTLLVRYPSALVTEKTRFSVETPFKRCHYFCQINRREPFFLIKFACLLVYACYLLCAEKPDYIITTGALLSVPFCVIGKLTGRRVIFIETLARINTPSLTGRLIYPFADLFIIQWKELLSCYKNAVYGGD